MSSKRTFYVMIGLILLFMLGSVASAYEINGMLGNQSRTLVDAKAKLAALQQEQVELRQAKKDIATYNDLYQISKVVVPENKDQVEAVRQIVNIAGSSGVSIKDITFPASTLGGNKIVGQAGAGSVSPAGASALGSGNAATLSQLQKVPNIPGVYVLQLTVDGVTNSSANSYPELINFLAGLERNRLTALVSDIVITPPTSEGQFQFTLTLNIYIKPGGFS